MLGCNARMSVACIRFLLAAILAMASTCTHAADAVSFAARDGVQVFADYYSAGSKAKPLILLFHQSRFKSRGIRNDWADAGHARVQRTCDRSTIWW